MAIKYLFYIYLKAIKYLFSNTQEFLHNIFGNIF